MTLLPATMATRPCLLFVLLLLALATAVSAADTTGDSAPTTIAEPTTADSPGPTAAGATATAAETTADRKSVV